MIINQIVKELEAASSNGLISVVGVKQILEEKLGHVTHMVTQGCHKDYCLGTDGRWPKCPNCGSVWSEELKARVIVNHENV
jgi:hypothetical protein